MHLVIDQLFCDTIDFDIPDIAIDEFPELASPHRSVWEHALALCAFAHIELIDAEHVEIRVDHDRRCIHVMLRSAAWVRETVRRG